MRARSKVQPPYRAVLLDAARMSTIYLVAHTLSSASDGEATPFLCGRFWSALVFVLLGVATFHLVVLRFLPEEMGGEALPLIPPARP